MNDKQADAQKKRARDMIEKWRDILGLQGHRIDIEYDRSYAEEPNTVGSVRANWQYRSHGITLYLPKIAEIEDDDELEESLVHELVHILLHPVTGYFTGKSNEEVEIAEYTTTTVAFALIWARNHGIDLGRKEPVEVNRFEIINWLSDGKGREKVVWKGEPFKVEPSFQDDNRTLKIFLSDKAKKVEHKTEAKSD